MAFIITVLFLISIMQQSLSDGHLKTLEYRFHNESLETYDEVVTGLTTSAQYLINVRLTSICM